MFEHLFKARVVIPAPRDEVFAFFSDAGNLMRLTPPSLGFEILTPAPIPMRDGTLIDYRIRLRGFPMRWRTRINRWRPPFEFEDEQLSGPYRIWIHRHSFADGPDGTTLMDDEVRYALPLPPFGEIALPFVRAEIRGIFAFREKTIREIFPAKE
ncbi:MAG TPA: SRPBCC family protein [Chthoniobacterales bacterium]|nr:SRPBCC family protein [Chthoniobacterales bacterium]